MKNKTLFNSLIFSFSLIGSCLVLDKPIKAGPCPDPSTQNISQIGTSLKTDPESFWSLTGVGYCTTTPEQYGVKIFKMGFCKKNPGNPNGGEPLVNQNIDYSSCTWAFENTDGRDAEFTKTSSIDLPAAGSSKPAAGTYPYAVMIMSNELKIKGKYGPVGGVTYYTRNVSSLTDYGATTDINKYAVSTTPVLFTGPENCLATIEGGPVAGGTMSGYLLNSTGKIIDGDLNTESNGAEGCINAKKLLGVVAMTNDITIDDDTNGLKMTFTVTNGMNATLDGNGGATDGQIEFISMAFGVTFETF